MLKPELTTRERDVLGLLAQGFTQKKVATKLGIEVSTVQTHTKSIYSKFHAHNLVAAIRQAEKHGFIF